MNIQHWSFVLAPQMNVQFICFKRVSNVHMPMDFFPPFSPLHPIIFAIYTGRRRRRARVPPSSAESSKSRRVYGSLYVIHIRCVMAVRAQRRRHNRINFAYVDYNIIKVRIKTTHFAWPQYFVLRRRAKIEWHARQYWLRFWLIVVGLGVLCNICVQNTWAYMMDSFN